MQVFLFPIYHVASSATSQDSSITRTVAISISCAVMSGIIGMLFWRYKIYKEAARGRKKHPLANRVKEQLKLDITDFSTDKGMEYIDLMDALVEKLQASGVTVKHITRQELNSLSVAVAKAIKQHCNITRSKFPGRNTFDATGFARHLQDIVDTTKELLSGQQIELSVVNK